MSLSFELPRRVCCAALLVAEGTRCLPSLAIVSVRRRTPGSDYPRRGPFNPWAERPSASVTRSQRLRLLGRLRGRLAGAVHRRLDRIQEGRAHACLLELSNRADRRSARGGDRLAELDRVELLVPEKLCGADHRLHHEWRRNLAAKPEEDPRLDHRLGEQREV